VFGRRVNVKETWRPLLSLFATVEEEKRQGTFIKYHVSGKGMTKEITTFSKQMNK
jgi:hypothetical protein